MHDKRSIVVWIDSSQLGICALLAKIYGFKVIVFYHNVELNIIKTLQGPRFAKLIRSIPIRFGEYLSARFSDFNFFLTENDRLGVKKIYGVENSFTIPPVLKREIFQYTRVTATSSLKVGFLGSDWFPNVLAVKFITKLAEAHKDIEFIIAGGVSKSINFSIPINVKIVGYIKNISEFYNSVDLIISPVTIGSGMKIKVLEAFQHNKIVFGSTHSLSGYEAYKDLTFYAADTLSDYSILFNRFRVGEVSEKIFERIPSGNEDKVAEMIHERIESLLK